MFLRVVPHSQLLNDNYNSYHVRAILQTSFRRSFFSISVFFSESQTSFSVLIWRKSESKSASGSDSCSTSGSGSGTSIHCFTIIIAVISLLIVNLITTNYKLQKYYFNYNYKYYITTVAIKVCFSLPFPIYVNPMIIGYWRVRASKIKHSCCFIWRWRMINDCDGVYRVYWRVWGFQRLF